MTKLHACRFSLMLGTACLAVPSAAQGQTVAIPAGEQAPTPVPGRTPDAVSDQAQPLPSGTDDAQADDGGAIVVTGSRIVANGYQAPTPVTVVSSTELLKKAPESIAAGLKKLPQFANTSGTNVTNSQAGSPGAGNYLNLRHLGSIENLVLLNGQRLPPTSFDGTVDTNIIPQALVERVDVVTGGASAAYGSDAVSGVINFILDTDFNGVKGAIQKGISSRGDDAQTKLNLAFGKSFLGDRLHAEFSFDYFHQPGIKDNGQRPYGGNYEGGWVETGAGTIDNPYTPTANVRLGHATYGTLINVGQYNQGFSLRGYEFLPGGKIKLCDCGTPTGTANYNVGGDGAVSFGATLTSKLRTRQGFGRLDYDFDSGVHAFLQGSYTDADTSYVTVAAGTQFNSLRIFADNAFLPDIVRQTMLDEGVESFVASRVEADQTPKRAYTNNEAYTILTGVDGKVGGFRWNVTYSHGSSTLHTRHTGNFDQRLWYAALDAVRDPATGNIVCNITLTNPGLQDDCVPWNPFGKGSPSAESYAYVEKESKFAVRNKQDDVAVQLTGALFDLPAGAVNLALGGEWRHQSLDETSNTDPSKPIDLTGLRTYVTDYVLQFNSTNVGSAHGSQSVYEGFGELAVPILKDVPGFRSFDLNGAARYTHYSTSGTVWAWKGGFSWVPVDQLRLRGTYSRDIRAPTLYELFAGVSSTRGSFSDIHTGGNTNIINLRHGNPDLKPEIARTLTLGAIWQPDFLPGFSASIDYYQIHLKDQINRLGSGDINERCEQSGGTDVLCQYIDRPFPFPDHSPANFPTTITQVPFNQASLKTHGWDYEINYRLNLGPVMSDSPARLDLRLIGNYTPTVETKDGPTSDPVENAGLASYVPHHKFTVSADYSDGPMNLGVEARYIGVTHYTMDPDVIYTNNRIAPVTYVNVNLSYDIDVGNDVFTVYGAVTNLFDKFVFAPQRGQPTEFYPTFQSQYDVVGRYFVAGVRFDF